MSRPLSMTDTAAEVGLSYERFRKIWRAMCADQDFPSPLYGRKWDRDAVSAWKVRRSALRVVTEIPARPEPEVRTANARAANTQAARDRAALQQLRAG